MSLHLGRIPFGAGRRPYATARRQRRRERDAQTRLGTRSFDAVKSVPHQGTQADVTSPLSGLSILPDTFAPRYVTLRLSAVRMRRSFAASVGSHVVGGGLLMLLIALAPEPVLDLIEPNRKTYEGIIWLPQEGPGGGGGGGGNESLEPPRPVQIEGPNEAELSVPVAEEPHYVEPEVEPEPLDLSRLNIPAITMTAALETLPGSMESINAARDSLSQGSGAGGGASTGRGVGIGPGEGPGLGPGSGGGTGGSVYRPGAGIVTPRPLHRARPVYTPQALKAQVQGEVWLEVVVLPDGSTAGMPDYIALDAGPRSARPYSDGAAPRTLASHLRVSPSRPSANPGRGRRRLSAA